jgi:hypothetical protein
MPDLQPMKKNHIKENLISIGLKARKAYLSFSFSPSDRAIWLPRHTHLLGKKTEDMDESIMCGCK